MLTVSEWVSDNITSRASGGAKNEKAIITMKSVFLWFRTIYLLTTVALSQLLHQFFNIGIGDDAAERDSSGQLEENPLTTKRCRWKMKRVQGGGDHSDQNPNCVNSEDIQVPWSSALGILGLLPGFVRQHWKIRRGRGAYGQGDQ